MTRSVWCIILSERCGGGQWVGRVENSEEELKRKKKSEDERITLKVVVDASGLERAAGKNSSLCWW